PNSAGGLWGFIRKYLLSFSIVMGIGFLMLVSFILSTVLSLIGTYFSGLLPGMEALMKVIAFMFSFLVISMLFAVLFKFLPDVKVRWRDVAVGAVLTSFLFTVGKFALGYYFTKAHVESAYGAAGSLILILLWVFYSAQILFFGAEFTQVHARHQKGQLPLPDPRKLTGKERLVANIETERREFASLCEKIVATKSSREKDEHYFSKKEDYKKRFSI
ncbi:MAG: YihY/virulence factor BrkB family protein, partial [Limisphaerales bacterium]